ncbi:hypothetical protein J6G99_01460 [bacterium]|nr:hypothetical protein [bacterium]
MNNEQAVSNNSFQGVSVKDMPAKEKFINSVQKFYKENLEQDEINFLNKAKKSKDNDLEFSKL